MYIDSVSEFDKALTDGPYAWPGGYPLFFVTSDGVVLSFKAARENADLIRNAIVANDHSGWRVAVCDVNWEDADLICDQTGERIESAYGE